MLMLPDVCEGSESDMAGPVLGNGCDDALAPSQPILQQAEGPLMRSDHQVLWTLGLRTHCTIANAILGMALQRMQFGCAEALNIQTLLLRTTCTVYSSMPISSTRSTKSPHCNVSANST